MSLVNVYSSCFDWAAFQLLRIGDNKYNLIVQKYSNGQYCIKFYKNRT